MKKIISLLGFIVVIASLAIGYWVNPYYALVFFAIAVLIILLWRTTF